MRHSNPPFYFLVLLGIALAVPFSAHGQSLVHPKDQIALQLGAIQMGYPVPFAIVTGNATNAQRAANALVMGRNAMAATVAKPAVEVVGVVSSPMVNTEAFQNQLYAAVEHVITRPASGRINGSVRMKNSNRPVSVTATLNPPSSDWTIPVPYSVEALSSVDAADLAVETSALTANVSALQTQSASLGSSLAAVQFTTANLSSNIASLQTAASTLSSNITGLQVTAATISSNLTTLDSRTSNISSNLTALTSQTSGISSNLTALASQTSGISSNLTALSSKVGNLSTNQTTLQQDTGALLQTIESLQRKLELAGVLAGEFRMIPVEGGVMPARSALAGQVVAPFEIGNYEVTWGEWKEVRDWAVGNGYSDLADTGRGNLGSAGNHPDNHPVVNVSWNDAVKWCNAKSEKEGFTPVYEASGTVYKTGSSLVTVKSGANGYRLPTELEWEWAALGGTSSKNFTYSGSNDASEVAWYGIQTTKAVGTLAANELGIHDMSGNVAELCFTSRSGSSNFARAGGGNFGTGVDATRIFYYNDISIDGRDFYTGFRLARNGATPLITLNGTFKALSVNGTSMRLFGTGFQHLKSMEVLQSSRFYPITPSAINSDSVDFSVPPQSGAAFLSYAVLVLTSNRDELIVANPSFDYTAPQRISSPINWTLGGSTLIIENGGEVTINGYGSGTFFVLNGGKLTGFGGGGSNRAWLEPQGQFTPIGGGGGGNEAIEVASISFTPLVSLPSL